MSVKMSDNTVTPAAETPAGKPSRRWPLLLAGLCLVAGVAGGFGWLLLKPKAPPVELAGDKLGLSRPDALLETRSQSQLP